MNDRDHQSARAFFVCHAPRLHQSAWAGAPGIRSGGCWAQSQPGGCLRSEAARRSEFPRSCCRRRDHPPQPSAADTSA